MPREIERREGELDVDVVFDVLSHPYRRFILSYLAREGRRVPMDELASRLAAWETGVPLAHVDEADRYSTHLSLYHTHLPKLADTGLIEWTERADRRFVAPSAAIGTIVADLLDGATEREPSYHVD